MYKKQSFFFFIFFIVFFFILNLFFYSFISIGLYKFICYDNQNDFLKVDFFNKFSNLFYFIYNDTTQTLIDTSFYQLILFSNFFFYKNDTFFFNILDQITINYLSYTQNHLIISNNNELNLIFLNFYIRCSNLN